MTPWDENGLRMNKFGPKCISYWRQKKNSSKISGQ